MQQLIGQRSQRRAAPAGPPSRCLREWTLSSWLPKNALDHWRIAPASESCNRNVSIPSRLADCRLEQVMMVPLMAWQ